MKENNFQMSEKALKTLNLKSVIKFIYQPCKLLIIKYLKEIAKFLT